MNFTIKNDRLEGEGAQFLGNAFAESQFVCLGEYHGSSKISELTTAFLTELSNEDFKNFLVEVGPHSAEKLRSLAQQKTGKTSALYDFNTKYYKATNEILIPFFDAKEDEAFLQKAIAYDYTLWGGDQEYIFSCFYLFDELLKMSEKEANYDAIQSAHQSAYAFAKNELQLFKKDDDHPFCKNLLDAKEIASFFDLLNQKNDKVVAIITSLKTSWDIYYNYDNNRNKNLEDRSALMKQLFVNAYKNAQIKEALPKFFIKMGRFHTMRGNSPNAVYEIGNLTHELATFNDTKDLNISILGRFFFDEEEKRVIDNLEYNSLWVKSFTPFYKAGKQDQWTIIDLRPLKEAWINRKYIFDAYLKDRLKTHDIIIIPPVDYDPVPNYEN
jgi:hypothetical protein